MNFFDWSQLALVCLLGAMSPGPSLALVIRNSISYNRIAGISCAIGHGLGMSLYASFVIIGLGIITFAPKVREKLNVVYTRLMDAWNGTVFALNTLITLKSQKKIRCTRCIRNNYGELITYKELARKSRNCKKSCS